MKSRVTNLCENTSSVDARKLTHLENGETFSFVFHSAAAKFSLVSTNRIGKKCHIEHHMLTYISDFSERFFHFLLEFNLMDELRNFENRHGIPLWEWKQVFFCSLIFICTIWRFSRTINVNLHQLKNRIRFHTKHHDSCHDIVAVVVVVIVPSRLIAGSLLFTISILNVH